jgi:hypothetical protein
MKAKNWLFLVIGSLAAIVGFYCLAQGSWPLFVINMIIAAGDMVIAFESR